MSTTQLFSADKLATALSVVGGTALGELRNDLLVQAIVAVANRSGGGGGSGTVTSVTSANAEITIADPTTAPVLTLGSSFGAKTFTGLVTLTPAAVNTGLIASTGYSLTGSNATNAIDIAGTWNTSGSPTALKMNITNTASGAASLLMDLQVGSASQFSVSKAGLTLMGSGSKVGSASGNYFAIGSSATQELRIGSNAFGLGSGSFLLGQYLSGSLVPAATTTFYLESIVAGRGGFQTYDDIFWNTADLYLHRAGAASLQLGQNDSTTPTAQTLKAHNVTTGTGASLTLAGGTGSAAGGAVVLATSATTGAPVARLTAKANGVLNIAGVPTSSAGLATGDIWSNGGVLTVV